MLVTRSQNNNMITMILANDKVKIIPQNEPHQSEHHGTARSYWRATLRCTRLVTGAEKYTSSEKLLNELEWESPTKRIDYLCLTLYPWPVIKSTTSNFSLIYLCQT